MDRTEYSHTDKDKEDENTVYRSFGGICVHTLADPADKVLLCTFTRIKQITDAAAVTLPLFDCKEGYISVGNTDDDPAAGLIINIYFIGAYCLKKYNTTEIVG